MITILLMTFGMTFRGTNHSLAPLNESQ